MTEHHAMAEIEKYTYRVTWSEDDGEHVGLCAEFPSLSFLHAKVEGALRGIRALVRDAVADMIAEGEQPPEPLAVRAYSGEFRVRVPPSLHRDLTIRAAESRVSLNRLVSLKLARPD